MIALLVCWLVLAGLAGLLPGLDERSSPWLGVRGFGAFAALVLLMFLAQLPFHIPLVPAARLMALLAVGGVVRSLVRLRRPWDALAFLHPVFLLPLAAAAVAATRGGIFYEPLAWDELNNWLSWMHQAIVFGHVDAPEIINPVLGYTPGWPIILAFPDLLLGGIDESRSNAMFFLLHVAMLGLVYDVVVAAGREAGCSGRAALLGAWSVLLAALAVEATWKLMPTNLLIEEPQTYTLAACVFLCVAAAAPKADPLRSGTHIGLALTAGYLIKVSALAFALPLLLLWAAAILPRLRTHPLPALAGTVALGLPILAAYAVWMKMGAVTGCMANPLPVARGLMDGTVAADRAADLWHRFSAAEIEYLRAYKFPVTVLSAAGLVTVLLSRRTRVVPLALFVYAVLYFGALYAYHLDCFGEYYFQVLNSIDRFTRVPLRLVHLCGLVLPVIAAAPLLARFTASRIVMVGLGALAVVLGGYQVAQLRASLISMATRADATPEQVSVVRAIRTQSVAIARLVDAQPQLGQNIVQIVQRGEGYQWVIARYYGLGHFKMGSAWSWGSTAANVWMTAATPEQAAAALLSASLVWPITLDDWMMGVLRRLVPDQGCLAVPTDHLFVPDPAAGKLRCLDAPWKVHR